MNGNQKMKLKFMELAKKMASFGEHRQHKVGSAISKKNRLVSLGFNKASTHPKSPHPWKFLHAEVSSLLKAGREELVDSTIYVYRETRSGMPALSRPCKYCMMALLEAGVKDVYYTIEEEPYFQYEEIA